MADHVVANMFLIPNAIFHGSPNITVGLYVWKGVIPALLGNIIGGGFFVGCLYWYLHLQGQSDLAVDGSYFESSYSSGRRSALNPWRRGNEQATKGDEIA